MLVVLLAIAALGALVGFAFWSQIGEWHARVSATMRSKTTTRLESMYLFFDLDRLPAIQLGSGGLVAGVFVILGWSSLGVRAVFLAIPGILCGLFLPQGLLWWLWQRRSKQFSEQLVDGLTLLSNGLRSGMNLSQALEMLVEEAPKPLRQEFAYVLREHQFGVDLDQALVHCAERTADDDLKLATIAIETTHRLGGNLAEVFDRLVTMIKDRKILKGKAEALTAQGRMQAVIVGVMPYVFLLFTNRVNPELVRLLFVEPIGWLLLTVMVTLDVVGYLWVRKVCTIKY